MDDIKLFAINEKELEILMNVVRIYSQDIGMKFGIKMWHTSNEKRQAIPDGWNWTAKSRKD